MNSSRFLLGIRGMKRRTPGIPFSRVGRRRWNRSLRASFCPCRRARRRWLCPVCVKRRGAGAH
eukprot:7782581-Alexandrium_andersonii.AAC.1